MDEGIPQVRMGKGVSNFWRYGQVGSQANERFLEALAHAVPKHEAIAELDRLCHPRTVNAQRFAAFNPVGQRDSRLFIAALVGSHLLNGFRNRDLTSLLQVAADKATIQQVRVLPCQLPDSDV